MDEDIQGVALVFFVDLRGSVIADIHVSQLDLTFRFRTLDGDLATLDLDL